MEQDKNENILVFVTKLRDQARFCGFTDANTQIFDKIVRDSKFSEVREIAFSHELTCQELLGEIMRVEEKARVECSQCGLIHYGPSCPAKNEKCMICKEIGHFARRCSNRSVKRSQKLIENKIHSKRAKLSESEEKLQRKENNFVEEIDLSIVKQEKDIEKPVKDLREILSDKSSRK